MTDHRAIHSRDFQRGMNLHREKPACWTLTIEAKAPRFFDQGRSCGAALTEALWLDTLRHTPGCADCWRAARAAAFWGTP